MGTAASISAVGSDKTPQEKPQETSQETPQETLLSPDLLLRFAESELQRPMSATDVTMTSALDEVKRLRCALRHPTQILGTGKVTIHYQMYDNKFSIQNGRLIPSNDMDNGVATLDDEYAFSFAMPGCVLDMVTCSLSEKIERDARGQSVPFVRKNKEGTEFEGLCTLDEYWVVVHEDKKQAKIAADKYAASLACEGIAKNEGKRKVGCSCIEGNPCTEGNKYNCKNWEMRFAIAKENGWNGQ